MVNNIALTMLNSVRQSRTAIQTSHVWKDWTKRLGHKWRGKVKVIHAGEWKEDGELAVQALHLLVTEQGRPYADLITLRSETVDVLVTVSDSTNNPTDRYVVFIKQWRTAVGRAVTSNVAGGKKWEETVEEAAQRELREELALDRYMKKPRQGLEVTYRRLYRHSIYASPGMLSERVYMLHAHIQLPPGQLKSFAAHLASEPTGNAEEGEVIAPHLIPVSQAWASLLDDEADGKTLLSLALAGYMQPMKA
jgi:ADP-ribose pyrophosphatase YjhB (NUDIX family)